MVAGVCETAVGQSGWLSGVMSGHSSAYRHTSCNYILESNSPCSASLADWMGRSELFAVFSEEKRETSGCISSLSSSGFSCGVCQC